MKITVDVDLLQRDAAYDTLAAVAAVLSKATGKSFTVAKPHRAEQSPFLSVRQAEQQLVDYVEVRLLAAWKAFVERTLRIRPMQKSLAADAAAVIGGRTYINPRSGKPLTNREWRVLQQQLTKLLNWAFAGSDDLLAKKAVALGKILHAMDLATAVKTPLGAVKDELEQALPAQYVAAVQFARQHAAEHITHLTDQGRHQINQVILQGQMSRVDAKTLSSRLFDSFATLNRDWRRVAETELASNVNNGYLTSELAAAEPDDVLYMIGVSAADACPWCASHVNGKVVVLRQNPPTGDDDTTEIDGTEYEVIWPGKNNVGRKQAAWWLAAGPQHPHCKCVWTRWHPQLTAANAQLRRLINKE